MSLSLDKALGISPQALLVRADRTELLASNLANAETPNYKARDVDFRDALSQAAGRGNSLPLKRTNDRHLPPDTAGAVDMPPERLYRVPAQPALDGNTVDPQLEHAAFAENAMQFQSSVEFLNRKVSGLKSALQSGGS
ncbi:MULTISPECIES: flagellar basal body rod protein FlgB [Thiorhodovibrio]|uniref:flagellar basal body rod protein FlgB n=1 Tax=Thiorhodovibrio TaxID=61593 RepID=UPI001911634D|nr:MULTISPECIES: flagellar basal body rod protein FlgB [Thiorhodovibrio]MBK5971035.1 flagellar basal-body rod protein FlgB [Thiorhodovibrio winogradskyi]WPL10598.1 Putative proximal rod protein [Thiorhodovibrio litoralis]